ncbi:hypothetical protein IIA16_03710 [bacterium]|nr:hypothetical protein [bacterium]
MRRRAVFLLLLAMALGASWLYDRGRSPVALPQPAATMVAPNPGGLFSVRILAPAGSDLRVVRDRQKILDRVLALDLNLEIAAREWVLVRVAEGLGLEILWRRGAGDWTATTVPEGPWEMTLIKHGNRITVYLEGRSDS